MKTFLNTRVILAVIHSHRHQIAEKFVVKSIIEAYILKKGLHFNKLYGFVTICTKHRAISDKIKYTTV